MAADGAAECSVGQATVRAPTLWALRCELLEMGAPDNLVLCIMCRRRLSVVSISMLRQDRDPLDSPALYSHRMEWLKEFGI
jgi:hypothetical protein